VLRFVVANTQFDPAEAFGVDNLLKDLLFEGDAGLTSPNPGQSSDSTR